MYQVSRLKTGLRVVTAEMPHMNSVSVGVWVDVGGRHEPESLGGISHFIEHLVFKGTTNRSARAISKAVEGVGGSLDAFTTEETTCFFAKARHAALPVLLDVLLDMVLAPRFDPNELEKERSVIKEEVAMYNDQPQQQVVELLDQMAWPNHPLGRPITGTAETVDAIDRDNLLDFHRKHYVAPNLVMAVAGRIEHEQVVQAILPYEERFPMGQSAKPLKAKSSQKRPRIRLQTKETEQTQLALGVRTGSRHDKRRFALFLLSTLLGEHSSSRLFQVIREDHGLVYSIYSALNLFEDTGLLTISAGVETSQLQQSIKLIMRELGRLTHRAPGNAELKLARDYLIGQMDLSLENTENQMIWLGEQLLGYDRIAAPATVQDLLHAVKPRDIHSVANDFFRPSRLNLALVSPIKSQRSIQQLLSF